MIVEESFIKKLRSSFNLNIYEAKIWTALLSKGVATAGELADISNVPRSRSYDILESLEKRGFVIMKLGKPIKYIAINPSEVLRRVKDSIANKAKVQLDLLENVKQDKLFREIELLHKQGVTHIEPNTLTGAIKGRTNIKNQLESLISNAKKSISIMTTTTGFIRKADLLKKLSRKLDGVKIRVAAPLNEECKRIAKELKNVEVKHLDKINSRFIIVDGKEIVFMVLDDADVHESYDIGIWANSELFAGALDKMFEHTWHSLN